MNLSFLIGGLILIVSTIISKIISENSIKLLDSEQKVKVVDTFSNMRKYYSIPGIVLLFGFLLFFDYLVVHISGIMILTILLVIIFSHYSITTFYIFKKLKLLNLPDAYLKKQYLSRTIDIVGVMFLFGIVISPIFI